MLFQVVGFPSFLRLNSIMQWNNIYIYTHTHTTSSLSIRRCFHALGIVTNATVNMDMHLFLQHLVVISIIYILGVGLLNHMVALFFQYFEEPLYCFP